MVSVYHYLILFPSKCRYLFINLFALIKKIYQKIRHKILIPLRIIPKEGLSNEKLALSITLGILSGMFPVIGGTTAVGLMMLAVLRQNLVTVQAVSWIVSPFQLLSIIPLMRLGSWILQKSPVRITLNQIILAFEPGIWAGLKNLGILHIYAVLAWLLIALPAGIVFNFIFLFFFRYFSRKKEVDNILL
jgi:uncharacterized protein (DUF2062 family)